MDRRQTIAGICFASFAYGLLSSHKAYADLSTNESTAGAPEELGTADFANAWDPVDVRKFAQAAAPIDVPKAAVESFSSTQLSSAENVRNEFIKRTGKPFIEFFNALPKIDDWEGKSISGSEVEVHFDSFWDSYMSNQSTTLMEFIAYMAIFINECNGDLRYASERYGNQNHPGITYLFDEFLVQNPQTGNTWRKRSYNDGKWNRTAGGLFNDPSFKSAHGMLAMADVVLGHGGGPWDGTRYPRESFPRSGDPSETGCILEADFFKFRGRGLIQTTWRANYIKLVAYIKNQGKSSTLLSYKGKWQHLSDDEVCTISRNSDWDAIFGDPSKEVLCEALRVHAKDGAYLPLSKTADGINGSGQSSLRHMGLKIGGSDYYGQALKNRVAQICLAMRL